MATRLSRARQANLLGLLLENNPLKSALNTRAWNPRETDAVDQEQDQVRISQLRKKAERCRALAQEGFVDLQTAANLARYAQALEQEASTLETQQHSEPG
jgi:hypothetical protein